MRFSTLSEWLCWQESLHPVAIDPGLERPRKVLHALGLGSPARYTVTVAGTNGKGSSVALLESIYRAAGYRVGSYTSPHLFRYNERIRIDGNEVGDETLCEAFERIDQARGTVSLTYFEFGTLAAFDILQRANLDIAILEVGLGGRLDAVNLLDGDVALITAIDIDHIEWLGETREAIAVEKAGIMRAGSPAVCSDLLPPPTLGQQALIAGAPLHIVGTGFSYELCGTGWRWRAADDAWIELPCPAIMGDFQLQNAAGVLMVVYLLQERLPLDQAVLATGLSTVRMVGRCQIEAGDITQVFDVAHNPQAARSLATALRTYHGSGQVIAVCAMLADKDIVAVMAAMRGLVSTWHLASLATPRGADAAYLAVCARKAGIMDPHTHNTVAEALTVAHDMSRPGDWLVIFGSFHAVAEAQVASV